LWLLRTASSRALEAQTLCRPVACDYPADLLHLTPHGVFSRAHSYTIWNGHIRYESEKEFPDDRLRSMAMRSNLFGESFNHLLGCPDSCRIGSYIEVKNPPTVRMAAFEDGQLLSEREILQSQVTMLTEG
jgi:hypothetical protein